MPEVASGVASFTHIGVQHMLLRMKLVVVLALLVGIFAVADEKQPAQPFNDAAFVEAAAMDALHQVELGKIGGRQAKRDEVKTFAEMLGKDHAAALAELTTAAKTANLPVPAKMGERYQKHVDTFKNYKGENFDRDFAKHQIEDHTEAIALFTRAGKDAKNKSVKDFATKALPMLQKHLETAKKFDK
jgi:putative membrane protein